MNTVTKFTKGSWGDISGDDASIDIVLPNDTTITIDRQSRYTGNYVIEREEMQANALLISKAPDMLEMLIKSLNHISDEYTAARDFRDDVETLISQATTL